MRQQIKQRNFRFTSLKLMVQIPMLQDHQSMFERWHLVFGLHTSSVKCKTQSINKQTWKMLLHGYRVESRKQGRDDSIKQFSKQLPYISFSILTRGIRLGLWEPWLETIRTDDSLGNEIMEKDVCKGLYTKLFHAMIPTFVFLLFAVLLSLHLVTFLLYITC